MTNKIRMGALYERSPQMIQKAVLGRSIDLRRTATPRHDASAIPLS